MYLFLNSFIEAFNSIIKLAEILCVLFSGVSVAGAWIGVYKINLNLCKLLVWQE